jgi:hypothetical protein
LKLLIKYHHFPLLYHQSLDEIPITCFATSIV